MVKRRGGGNKLLQYGEKKKMDFQTIYEWIVKMISMLFYGTKNQYFCSRITKNQYYFLSPDI